MQVWYLHGIWYFPISAVMRQLCGLIIKGLIFFWWNSIFNTKLTKPKSPKCWGLMRSSDAAHRRARCRRHVGVAPGRHGGLAKVHRPRREILLGAGATSEAEWPYCQRWLIWCYSANLFKFNLFNIFLQYFRCVHLCTRKDQVPQAEGHADLDVGHYVEKVRGWEGEIHGHVIFITGLFCQIDQQHIFVDFQL